jgi:predicted nucleotidyltransferase
MKVSDKLKKTLKILIDTIPKNVNWALSNGTAAFFYESGREPTDLDIATNSHGIKKITVALNEFLLEPLKMRKKEFFNGYIVKFKINAYEIEAYSDIVIKIADKTYSKFLDELQIKKIRRVKINGFEILLLSPEDVIASKALTQRGKEVDKHDIDDIKALLKNQKIDWKYLEERAKIMNGYERVFKLLKYLGYHS